MIMKSFCSVWDIIFRNSLLFTYILHLIVSEASNQVYHLNPFQRTTLPPQTSPATPTTPPLLMGSKWNEPRDPVLPLRDRRPNMATQS